MLKVVLFGNQKVKYNPALIKFYLDVFCANYKITHLYYSPIYFFANCIESYFKGYDCIKVRYSNKCWYTTSGNRKGFTHDPAKAVIRLLRSAKPDYVVFFDNSTYTNHIERYMDRFISDKQINTKVISWSCNYS